MSTIFLKKKRCGFSSENIQFKLRWEVNSLRKSREKKYRKKIAQAKLLFGFILSNSDKITVCFLHGITLWKTCLQTTFYVSIKVYKQS